MTVIYIMSQYGCCRTYGTFKQKKTKYIQSVICIFFLKCKKDSVRVKDVITSHDSGEIKSASIAVILCPVIYNIDNVR